uniref:uncharacterized protein LOC120338846 n=2 Tax=Styela clava TaxID=7725 RepID=UPI0019396E62|nr:uncharacterized protein LOC120338846 [Styela clava]
MNLRKECENWTPTVTEHPIQRDGSSCGIYVIKFAWMMLETKSIHVVSPIDERAKIASWVIQNSDCVETYCSFCGETGEAEWIGCDVCPRWFHAGCYNGDIAEILDVLWKCPAYEAGWH